MTEQSVSFSETLNKETHHLPEFDAGFFTINYFSTDPKGFTIQTRESLNRRDNEADRSFPSNLALTPEQRSELRHGMGNEAFFSLPKDFPQDKKTEVKQMFTLIDEVATLKDAGSADEKYQEKLSQLNELRSGLRDLFKQFKLTDQLGLKVGVRNIASDGKTLLLDTRPISYPMYAVAGSPEDTQETLDLGALTGTAAILVTADNKIILQHRSAKNSPYGDMPGASFAGMLDGKFHREIKTDPNTGKTQTERTGTLEPIDTEYVKESAATERQQEIALTEKDITDFRIVGEARDHVREHDEFLLLSKTSLTAQEVAQKAMDAPRSRNPRKLDDHGDFHFEENFITIDATPQAIETLLTQVKCPLPPTHAAAFVAAGYNLILEQSPEQNGGVKAANEWRAKMQAEVKRNYQDMNTIVANYYKNHPTELSNNKPGKPKRNPKGYEPYYTPQEQGLPPLGSELVRTGLISAKMPS